MARAKLTVGGLMRTKKAVEWIEGQAKNPRQLPLAPTQAAPVVHVVRVTDATPVDDRYSGLIQSYDVDANTWDDIDDTDCWVIDLNGGSLTTQRYQCRLLGVLPDDGFGVYGREGAVAPIRPLWIGTEDVSVKSTSLTTIVGDGEGSLSLPADWWTIGKRLRWRTSGHMIVATTLNTINPVFVYDTQLSLFLIANVSTGASSSNTVRWVYEGDLTCRTLGATGTFGVTVRGETIITNGGTLANVVEQGGNDTAAVTLDTTIAADLDLQVALTSAASTNELLCTALLVEVIDAP